MSGVGLGQEVTVEVGVTVIVVLCDDIRYYSGKAGI